MFSRTALLCLALLLAGQPGCQNAPEQFSLYAPFGPAVVPAPGLSRANSTPYYTPAGDAKGPGATTSPATATTTDGNQLSHYDPYRGILLPGTFTPTPVAARSGETWGAGSVLAATPPRERVSSEELIRVVEVSEPPRGLSSALNSVVSQGTNSRRSGAVQFQASPPSGAVRPGSARPALQPDYSIATIEVATRPKPPDPLTGTPPTPVVIPTTRSPASSTPGLLSPPSLSPPPAPKPGEPRPLSLWNDPRDGSRVMPAEHLEYVTPPAQASGSWRVRD